MPQYSWNSGFPGEPAPFHPAQVRDGDGLLVAEPSAPAPFRTIWGVWCDTETGEVRYIYNDFQTADLLGRMPYFIRFAKPPLTIEPHEPDPQPIIVGPLPPPDPARTEIAYRAMRNG